MLASSALLVCATFLVAECKVYWQFLCQGIAVGVSSILPDLLIQPFSV